MIKAWQASWSYFSQITPGWHGLTAVGKGQLQERSRYNNISYYIDTILLRVVFYCWIVIAGWFCFAVVGIVLKVLSDNCWLLTSTHCVPPVAWHFSVGATYSSWKRRTPRKVKNSSFPFCQAPGRWCAVLHSGGCSPGLREVWIEWDTSQGRFGLLFVNLVCMLPAAF